MIDLGVGFHTPGIIRWPMERLAIENEHCKLIRVNKNNVENIYGESNQVLGIQSDINQFLKCLNY